MGQALVVKPIRNMVNHETISPLVSAHKNAG